jgi:glucosamine-6-phosphate deaminase
MPLIHTFAVDALTVKVYDNADTLAMAAAHDVIDTLNQALGQFTTARVVLATGNSQIALLNHLKATTKLDWSRLVGFHLDEFLGLEATHPASFQHYLQTHLVSQVGFGAFHFMQGHALEPMAECQRYAQLLQTHRLDLGLLGIGDNGHLAFNDPAVANFCDPDWVKLVKLDEKNRQQQSRIEHFASLTEVPQYAITLTLSAIGQIQKVLCLANGQHKATVVERMLTGEISPDCPATFLRKHKQAVLMLDREAAHLLGYKPASALT